MKTRIVVFLLAAILLTACAGPNSVVNTPTIDGSIAGFWSGLWHGLVAPWSCIASLFDPHISMYEVHNNGSWYNLGFALGAGIIFRGSSNILNLKN